MTANSFNNKSRLTSFGAHVLPRDYLASWPDQEQRNREMLSHALNLRDTIVFVGAGCSIPLGYPSWSQLASDKAIAAAQFAIKNKKGMPERLKAQASARLEELAKGINHRANSPSDNQAKASAKERASQLSSSDLTYILGACERICEECGCATGFENEISFRGEIAKLFKDRQSDGSCNPYEALLDLPVHRFVTSNYDCELEHALVKRRGLRTDDYVYVSINFGKKSFAQTAKYDEQLATFSLAFAGYEPRVFHCHGWHCEPDSMVLTENDYQKWHLRDQAVGGGRYRQTIDLVFNSNPLLFVGFSLTDDDLLVPLRFLSAVDRTDKYCRPHFALLEKRDSNNENRFEQLYDRYGIHVLSYEVKTDEVNTTTARAKALCEEIKCIAECCKTHRKAWLLPPSRKEVESTPNKTFVHYQPIFDSSQEESTQDLALPGPCLAWIVGPGGTGKSDQAIRLLRSFEKDNKFSFEGFFFWSFRFSNDALNGIDRAVRFMGGTQGPAEQRLDELVQRLRNECYFVVLDGVERFLLQSMEIGDVDWVNSSYRRFVSLLIEKSIKSVLVLTSRILPSKFECLSELKSVPAIVIERSEGLDPRRIESILQESGIDDCEVPKLELAQSLRSWFGGHRYGVALAASWLAKKESFGKLEYAMAEADPEHRVSKMIGLSLKALRETESASGETALQLLERLAVFVEPVAKKIASLCLDSVRRDDFGNAVSLLDERKLLFKVRRYDGEECFMLHPSMREYIFHQHHYHHSCPADLPSFSLSGFTSGTETVYPGERESKGKTTVVDLFNCLAREGWSHDEVRVELCRATFGVVRSRMVATTISRWCRYDEYLRFLVRVIDSARRLSENKEHALYEDELAWLYNEAGLAYYGEGTMLDAIAVWEQSYDINKGLDQSSNGHYLFQSLCNLGAAHIHFGHLEKAELYLHKALEMGRRLSEDDHIHRIEGYLALLCHLRGNIGEANEKYKEVTQNLKGKGPRNMRAYSIFLRHHADLLLKQEATRAYAWRKIQTSKAVAEANSYEDLVAYARLSYGHLHRLEKDFRAAIREYTLALELARTMGLRRLEAEAQSELARVDLDLGDAHVARRRATQALQIANEHLLGLRQTHSLVILGKATFHSGERGLGIHYLKYAKRLADMQEYRLRASEAEAELFEMGESVQNSGVEVTSAA